MRPAGLFWAALALNLVYLWTSVLIAADRLGRFG
jgi:hypothetical protein